jgi:hypothetical protein
MRSEETQCFGEGEAGGDAQMCCELVETGACA